MFGLDTCAIAKLLANLMQSKLTLKNVTFRAIRSTMSFVVTSLSRGEAEAIGNNEAKAYHGEPPMVALGSFQTGITKKRMKIGNLRFVIS